MSSNDSSPSPLKSTRRSKPSRKRKSTSSLSASTAATSNFASSSSSRLSWPTIPAQSTSTTTTNNKNDDDDVFSSSFSFSFNHRRTKSQSTTKSTSAHINNKNKNHHQSRSNTKNNTTRFHSPSSSFLQNKRSSSNKNGNQLWVDKYKPTSIKDLCIAPKKIKEVREWMDQFHCGDSGSNMSNSYCNINRAKLLILTGSAGIGKSTMIHLLAKEYNWNVLEWNELVHVKTTSTQSSMSMSHQYESQLSSFDDFLSSSALGCNITLVNSNSSRSKNRRNDNVTATPPTIFGKRKRRYQYLDKLQQQNDENDDDSNISLGSPSKGSLVLIDEIPNLHTVENEQRFREIMTKYIQKAQIPTILIYSDVQEGKYNPDDLTKLMDPMILSSPSLTKIIQINPVTKAKMKQCMLRIMKGEGGTSLINTLVEEVHSQSGGDLRHAIMTLQFKFIGGSSNTTSNNAHHQGSNEMMSQQRDTRLSTFHALGKLLYAKRKVVQNHNNNNNNIDHHQYHNSPWNTDKRPPLEFNPEKVLEHCDIGLNGAINFVEYNCPDFFTDIDDLSTALSRYSDAAFLMDKSFVSSINDNSFPNGYATSLISRTAGDANKHPAPFKFRQFKAPKQFEVIRKKRENQAKVVQLCKKLSCRLDHLSLGATIWAASPFALEYYPLLKKIIPDEVSSLSTNLYSNDCFIVTKEYLQNQNGNGTKFGSRDHTHTNNGNMNDEYNSSVYLKEIEEQRKILAIDDIEDSSSDEMDMCMDTNMNTSTGINQNQNDSRVSVTASKSEVVNTQDSATKSEIIIIDDSD